MNKVIETKRPDMLGNTFAKGNVKSSEERKAISKRMKENPVKHWEGKKFTEEHKKKISESMLGATFPNRDYNGKNHPMWQGGSINYIKKQAKKRDDYTCQKCGMKDEEIIQVDHIIPRALDEDKYCDLDNLMCLCPNCHARKTLKDKKEIAAYKRSLKVTRT